MTETHSHYITCPHCGESLKSVGDMSGVECPACGGNLALRQTDGEPMTCPRCDHTLVEMNIAGVPGKILSLALLTGSALFFLWRVMST